MEPIHRTARPRGRITLGVLALGAFLLTGCMSFRIVPTGPVVSGPQATQFSTDSIPIGNNVTVQLQPAQYVGNLVIQANNVTIYGSGVNVTYIVGDVLITGNNCLLANLTVTGRVIVEGNNSNVARAQVNRGVAFQGPNYVGPARPFIVTPAPQPQQPPPVYVVPPNARGVQPVPAQPAPGYRPGGSSVERQPGPPPVYVVPPGELPRPQPVPQQPQQGREQFGQPQRPETPPGQVGREQQQPPGQLKRPEQQPTPDRGDQGSSDQLKRNQQGDQGDQGNQSDNRGRSQGR